MFQLWSLAGQWPVGGADQYWPGSGYTFDPYLSKYDTLVERTFVTKQKVHIKLMPPRCNNLLTPLLSTPIIVTQPLSSFNYRPVHLFFCVVELMSMNKPPVKLQFRNVFRRRRDKSQFWLHCITCQLFLHSVSFPCVSETKHQRRCVSQPRWAFQLANEGSQSAMCVEF